MNLGENYVIPDPRGPEPEHEELHAELAQATNAKRSHRQAAKALDPMMHAHFEKEEEYALPPLGVLADLAKGKI
jgi:hypothetical protein